MAGFVPEGIENIVRKGENAGNHHFLLFPRCFKIGVGKFDKGLTRLTLSHTSPGFYVSAAQAFENTVGKGEIARNEQFLLFPQCFLPVWRTFSHLHPI